LTFHVSCFTFVGVLLKNKSLKITLGEIAAIQTGVFAKPVTDGEVVYLQAKNFDEFGKLQTKLYPEIQYQSINEHHLLLKGDVLFAAKGVKNFASCFDRNSMSAVASTSFFVIRIYPKQRENTVPDYLAWMLNQENIQSFLKSKARGTSIPSIRKTDLEALEIELPPIEKQRIIIQLAELMEKEYALREQLQNLRKKLIAQQIIKTVL
jgi:restriction endonuclease S subunit